MSEIQDILSDLGNVSGIAGNAVLTTDGIMVASQLAHGVLDDVVAGLSSFLISTTSRTLKEAGMGGFSRFVLHSTHGRMVFVDIGDAVLVVLMTQFANIDDCLHDVHDAAAELRKASRIQL